MSHRSFGSLKSDTVLDGDTSVQNVDGTRVSFEIPLEEEQEEDKSTRVQGFFGVRPWSIKLAPSNPQPIADSTPGTGTFLVYQIDLRNAFYMLVFLVDCL